MTTLVLGRFEFVECNGFRNRTMIIKSSNFFNITQKFDGDENEKKIEGPCNTGLDWITD